MNLMEKLADLYKQATTEKSHYYVASVVEESMQVLMAFDIENRRLEAALKVAKNSPQHAQGRVEDSPKPCDHNWMVVNEAFGRACTKCGEVNIVYKGCRTTSALG